MATPAHVSAADAAGDNRRQLGSPGFEHRDVDVDGCLRERLEDDGAG
jgi:hypothetical protein